MNYVRTGVVISILLMMLCYSVGEATEDITLPFDYFYGRWQNGHYYTGTVIVQDTEDPSRTGDYALEQGKYRFGVDRVQNYLLIGNSGGITTTPVFSFSVRPHDGLQLGIDSINYFHSSQEGVSFECTADSYDAVANKIRSGASVHWIRGGNVRLSDNDAPYFYLTGNILSKGYLAIDGRTIVSNELYRTYELDYWFSNFDSVIGIESEYDKVRRTTVTAEASVAFGLADATVMSLDLTFNKYYDKSVSVLLNSDWDDGPPSTYLDRETYGTVRPSYNIAAIQRIAKSIYASGSWQQVFNNQRNERSLRVSEPGMADFVRDTVVESDVYQFRHIGELRADFITRGDFESSVVLDDYNNFYNHMLANRQIWASVRYSEEFRRDLGYDDYEYKSEDDDIRNWKRLNLSAAYGLLGRASLNVSSCYELLRAEATHFYDYIYHTERIRDTTFYALINTSVTLRLRSYDYRKGGDRGWDKDSEFEIAYGSILRAGEWCMKATYHPPSYAKYQNEETGFLSLSGMKSNRLHQLSIDLSIGLGEQIEITASDSLHYSRDNWYSNYYSIGCLARRFNRFEVSAVMAWQKTHHWENEANLTATGTLRVLL